MQEEEEEGQVRIELLNGLFVKTQKKEEVLRFLHAKIVRMD